MEENIRHNIQEVYRLMSYDRSKTLREQTVPMNIVTGAPPEERQKKKNPCDDYVSPNKCRARNGQDSLCPGNKDDFDWDNHCYYPGYTDDGPKLLGVKTTDKVEFVDVNYFRKFMQGFINIGRKDVPELTTEFLEKHITNYSTNNAAQFANFRRNVLYKEKDEMFLYDYITKKTVTPGVMSKIFADGKVYRLMYEFSVESAYQGAPSQNIDYNNFSSSDVYKKMTTAQNEKIVTLRPVGYISYRDNEEFEGVSSSDTRSGWDKFIDGWGTTIQIVGAIGFGIAGAYTGGATWALAAEIAIELGMGIALAQRALEKGDAFGASMEILFGLFPLLKTTNILTGISDEAMEALAKKWTRYGIKKSSSPAEIARFWSELTQEEAETLARIARNEDELIRHLSNLVGKPKVIVKDLLKQIDNIDEAKKIIIKFWTTSAGRELKYQGYLAGLDAFFGSYFPNEHDKETMQIINIIMQGASLELQKEFAQTFLGWTPEQIKNKLGGQEILNLLNMGTMGDTGRENIVATASESEGIPYQDLDSTLSKTVTGNKCPNGYFPIYLPGSTNFNNNNFKKYTKYLEDEDSLSAPVMKAVCILSKHKITP